MGFTFSFAWTPCVGPALSSVLIMASSSANSLQGNLLVLIYAVGFVLPFLALGLFTTQALNFLKKHQKLLKYTVKAGGILLILIGIMTFTGWMNGISAYVNRFLPQTSLNSPGEESGDVNNTVTNDSPDPSGEGTLEPAKDKVDASEEEGQAGSENSASVSPTPKASQAKEIIPAFDFTLVDQYGTEHTLSEYKGKVVFLNFWATWCPPCQKEMPDIEALYQETGMNQEDIIVLGVANPANTEYPNNSDVSKEEVIAFLDENNYTFPVVFDETGEVLSDYYISSFPTTFFIDTEGNIYGYLPTMMTREMMDNALQQTIDAPKQ
jgi:cytochrome c-type biogenesis protein